MVHPFWGLFYRFSMVFICSHFKVSFSRWTPTFHFNKLHCDGDAVASSSLENWQLEDGEVCQECGLEFIELGGWSSQRMHQGETTWSTELSHRVSIFCQHRCPESKRHPFLYYLNGHSYDRTYPITELQWMPGGLFTIHHPWRPGKLGRPRRLQSFTMIKRLKDSISQAADFRDSLDLSQVLEMGGVALDRFSLRFRVPKAARSHTHTTTG